MPRPPEHIYAELKAIAAPRIPDGPVPGEVLLAYVQVYHRRRQLWEELAAAAAGQPEWVLAGVVAAKTAAVVEERQAEDLLFEHVAGKYADA